MQTSKRILKAIANADDVYEGINNFNIPKKEFEDLAFERSKICVTCEHIETDPVQMFHVEDRVESLSKKMCGLCGCILAYKLRTKIINTENCPLKNG